MISSAQIEAAKTVNLVALVGQVVKLNRRGSSFWGCCPFHAEKTPSFKVNPQTGRFKCFGCGAAGDAVDWIRETEKLTFPKAVEALAGSELPKSALHETPVHDHQRDAQRIREVRERWHDAKPIAGTHAARYLAARGIADTSNPSLKFMPSYEYAGGVILPAMVSALVGIDRKITAAQITFLHPREPRKACVATQRRTLGPMGAGAVRLAPVGGVLGLAEGVEDALSAIQLTGIPCWAALGAQRMHQVAIPEGVRELHVFADDDDAGRNAAERVRERHGKRLKVEIRMPPGGAKDWNDALRAQKGAA